MAEFDVITVCGLTVAEIHELKARAEQDNYLHMIAEVVELRDKVKELETALDAVQEELDDLRG